MADMFHALYPLFFLYLLPASKSCLKSEGCHWFVEDTSTTIIKCHVNGSIILANESRKAPIGTVCEGRNEIDNHVFNASCISERWVLQHATEAKGTKGTDIEEIGKLREKRFIFRILRGILCLIFCWIRPMDTTRPVITPPLKDLHLFADPIQTNKRDVAWTEPTARDNKDGNVPVTRYGPGPHYTFSSGATTVTYVAKDRAGNRASMTFTVHVAVVRCNPGPSASYPNGYYVCHPSSDFVLGTTCWYGCYSGYEIRQPNVRVCEKQGQHAVGRWSRPEPVCQKVTCPTLTIPPDSTYSCTEENSYQSKCTYKCHSGYDVKPGMSRIRVCTAQKIWRGNSPVCIDNEAPKFITCPSYKTFFPGKDSSKALVSWNEPTATDNSGRVQVQMKSRILNANLTSPGLYKVEYTATDQTGNSGHKCMFKVAVRELRCPTQYPRPNMRVNCPAGYRYGSTCFFSCQSGYELHGGNDTTTCDRPNNDADYVKWNAQPTFCQAVKTCPPLEPPGNGALACDLWVHGRFCQIQCRNGTDIAPKYGYRHQPIFVCGESGRWNVKEALPDCAKVTLATNAKKKLGIYSYFYGMCPDKFTRDQIKENFIKALQQSSYKEIWNRSNSNIKNVKVFCGRVITKRSVQRSEELQKLQITTYIMTPLDSSHDVEQQFEQKERALHSMIDGIKSDEHSNSSWLTSTLKVTGTDIRVEDTRLELDCPLGTFPTYRTWGCVGCVRGSYYDVESGKCELCPAGQYQDMTDQTGCKPCPQHTTTLFTGAKSNTLCFDQCKPGTFSASGLEPCNPCDISEYQDEWGKSSCKHCPGGRTTVEEAITDINSCQEFDIEFPANANASSTLNFPIDVELQVWALSFSMRTNGGNFGVLQLEADNETLLSVYQDNNHKLIVGQDGSIVVSYETMNDSMWHHYVVSVSPGQSSMYIDGNLMELIYVGSNYTTTTNSLFIRLGGAGFVGSISQVNVWSKMRVPVPRCFGNDPGDILSWRELSKVELINAVVQIPSECDDEDACVSGPCVQGDCSDELDGYRCVCKEGFTGANCDTNIDDCVGHVCANNATCVDSTSNYTCLCAPQFTGEFCDDVLVHGQWGTWGNWTECTVSCGGGVKTRSRRCDHPLPQNGGDFCKGDEYDNENCSGTKCPVCPEVRSPQNGALLCSNHRGMLKCNVSCKEGYDFDIPSLPVYECGNETGYVWSFETKDNPNRTLPNCMELQPAEELKLTYKAHYINLFCNNTNMNTVKDRISALVQRELSTQPCAAESRCGIVDFNVTNCNDDAPRQRRQVATTGFTMTIQNKPLEIGLTLGLEDMQQVIYHLNKSAETGIFTVNVGGTDYFLNGFNMIFKGSVTCKPGLTRVNLFCVPCGPGTFYINDVCERCPRGRYQQEIAQTNCKHCPSGKTTHGLGATTVAECSVDGPPTPEWSSPITAILTTVIVFSVFTLGLIVVLCYNWSKRNKNVQSLDGESSAVHSQPQNTILSNGQATTHHKLDGHEAEPERLPGERNEASGDSPDAQSNTDGACLGSRPGCTPMPHRTRQQPTSGLLIINQHLPKVNI